MSRHSLNTPAFVTVILFAFCAVGAFVRSTAAGNLIFDGTHAYHYDAWNRLIQVNRAELESDPGIPPAPAEIELGLIVKRYTYDGLGRLIRTRSPWPDPDTSTGEQLEERFAYDGIRRIQEVAVKLASNGTTQSTTLAREYVWGPGDNGVDELLAQFGPSPTRAPTFILQDAGLDVIAVCDLGGTPSTPFPNGTARIVWQGSYDAYGSVIASENLHAHANLRAGHKGLFFDRLDLGVVDPTTFEETPRLVAGADLLGHVRNRVLRPPLGRWLQRDPNATGAVLMASAMQGTAMPVVLGDVDLAAHYGDGTNAYEYLGSSGWNGTDPMGLYMWGDWTDTLATGAEVFALAWAVGETHQFVTGEAMEWAADWSRSDDEIDDLRALANAFSSDVDAEVGAIAGPYGPIIAQRGTAPLKLGKVAVRGYRFSAKLQKLFDKWLGNGPENVSVYVLKRNGSPYYVGITNSTVRRGGEHGTDAISLVS